MKINISFLVRNKLFTQLLVSLITILSLGNLCGQNVPYEVKVPLKDVMNTIEGPFFNNLEIWLDEYRSRGKGGNESWIKFNNKEIERFTLGTLFKTGAQRWHLNNLRSNGIDLRPTRDAKIWNLSFEFEEDEREIICITRISGWQDRASSGHIRNPQVDVKIKLVNIGNSISYQVLDVNWKGKVDLAITWAGFIDKAIDKIVKPKLERRIKNAFQKSIKISFNRTVSKLIGTSNGRIARFLSKYNIPTSKITRLQIKGNSLVVTIMVPKRVKDALDRLDSMNFELSDITTFVSNGKSHFLGVWQNGKNGGSLYQYDNFNSFVNKWKELNKKNQKLIDISTFISGGKRHYIGTWQKGNDGGALYQYDNFNSFVNKWKDLGKKNQKLIAIETFKADGKNWYLGVWQKGNDGGALYQYDNFNSFVDKWKVLF